MAMQRTFSDMPSASFMRLSATFMILIFMEKIEGDDMRGFFRFETTSGVEIYGNFPLSLDTPLCGSHFGHDMS